MSARSGSRRICGCALSAMVLLIGALGALLILGGAAHADSDYWWQAPEMSADGAEGVGGRPPAWIADDFEWTDGVPIEEIRIWAVGWLGGDRPPTFRVGIFADDPTGLIGATPGDELWSAVWAPGEYTRTHVAPCLPWNFVPPHASGVGSGRIILTGGLPPDPGIYAYHLPLATPFLPHDPGTGTQRYWLGLLREEDDWAPQWRTAEAQTAEPARLGCRFDQADYLAEAFELEVYHSSGQSYRVPLVQHPWVKITQMGPEEWLFECDEGPSPDSDYDDVRLTLFGPLDHITGLRVEQPGTYSLRSELLCMGDTIFYNANDHIGEVVMFDPGWVAWTLFYDEPVDFAFAVIPEPATLGLLAAGLLVAAARQRRVRRFSRRP